MGNIGWSGIIIVAILVVLLFGRGKISSIMGDVAKGIKSFKKGMSSDDEDQSKNSPAVDQSKSSPAEENPNEDSNSEKK